MATLLCSLLIVFGSMAASVGGLLLANKYVDKSVLRKHQDLAGHTLAVVGTMTAVLLGLVVVEAQNRYQQARMMEAQESNSLADLRR